MNDTSQKFDTGSTPVSAANGPDDPDRMQQGVGPEATEHDEQDTAQDDGFLAQVEAQLPRGYQLDPEDSLIKRYSAREGVVEICQPFYVKHLEVARPTRPAQLVVVLRTASGARREVSLPADDLGKGSPKGVAKLRGVGLRVFATDTKFADLLRSMDYETVDPPVLRPGWASFDPPVYVLSDGGVLSHKDDRDRLALSGPVVTVERDAQERWTREVATKLTGNPLALFLVCAQFAGPLLKVVGAESAIYNLSAHTSQAKSFLLELALRVWPQQDLLSWTATRASLDDACLLANDGALGADEVPQGKVAKMVPQVFAIVNGSRRSARPAPGAEFEPSKRRVIVITSSEQPFCDQAVSEARRAQGSLPISRLRLPVQEGTFVRLLDIGGRDHKIWRKAHGHTDIPAMLSALDIASQETAGIAGPAFVQKLLAPLSCNQGDLRAAFETQSRELAVELGIDAGSGLSPETRVMRHFAVVLLAGQLAVRFGLLPQTVQQVRAAVLEAADSWAKIRGLGRHRVDEDPLATIRAWTWPRLGKELREVDAARRPVDRKPWGARGWFNEEHYFLLRETLMEFVPPGGTFKDLREILEQRGALLTDDRLPSKQIRMSSLIGPDIRVYQLCREVIDREVECDEEDETNAESER
ncbi:uncharacterized protein DUF927 [Roseinatronobacter thiooxidans]|uniref:Uncharacterized protein DUF927 n=1 Tax=Roseinatronobacter thiooxidans TaxID=121821 RepID=A0A2W7RFL3_9RHOB|nr:DUF927 domain-containing protein [Roseinatronobacter thiooxidans]PZX36742.1 uncharacterized protein DUF927 [Roseinatronobacter thiooxidans]